MNLHFKERLAFLYLVSTATIIGLLLIFIIFTVRQSVFNQLDKNLITEVNKHQSDIIIKNDTLHFNQNAWMEIEHQMLEINPVFVEIVDNKGNVIEKSPNLKKERLRFIKNKNQEFANYKLDSIPIRQYQIRIIKNGRSYGYLIVGMSHKNAQWIMKKLKRTLIIAYPVVLILLFFWALFIAGRSIKPVKDIINTANLITKNNLKERIKLPGHQDELYLLAQTINKLLDRLEKAIEREKQFTSDAAHELKTPLQVMKGNIEVLLRKPRTNEEYAEKIKKCIREINRMSHLVDQLLLLARFESQQKALDIKNVSPDEIIEQVIQKKWWQIKEKNIQFKFNIKSLESVRTDPYLIHIIIDNLLSNAIKYTPENGKITIETGKNNGHTYINFINSGKGIKKDDIPYIFDRFYRSGSVNNPKTKGTGLGLSIVKRLTELLQMKISVQSDKGKTQFRIEF
jgi:heavy metal sensor kinase